MVKETRVVEQRSQPVLAVIANRRDVGGVATQFGLSRYSVHAWLRRYENHGSEALANKMAKGPHRNYCFMNFEENET